jgi:hypothetical protein
MAKRPRHPTESRLIREPIKAFARRHRTDGGDDGGADDAAVKPAKTAAGSGPNKTPDPGTVGGVTTDAAPPAAPTAPADAPTTVAPTPPPGAAPDPAPAVAAAPPAPAAAPPTPAAPAAAPATAEKPVPSGVEGLPLMPHPNQIPSGNPDDVADPPGIVPPGDSRSLRRGGEFVLVYRVANIVVSRFGPVGRRGQFRVVEYPTTTYASNAYARECSRWVSEGYSDYRGP